MVQDSAQAGISILHRMCSLSVMATQIYRYQGGWLLVKRPSCDAYLDSRWEIWEGGYRRHGPDWGQGVTATLVADDTAAARW